MAKKKEQAARLKRLARTIEAMLGGAAMKGCDPLDVYRATYDTMHLWSAKYLQDADGAPWSPRALGFRSTVKRGGKR